MLSKCISNQITVFRQNIGIITCIHIANIIISVLLYGTLLNELALNYISLTKQVDFELGRDKHFKLPNLKRKRRIQF